MKIARMRGFELLMWLAILVTITSVLSFPANTSLITSPEFTVSPDQSTLKIVATTSIVADVVENIAGSNIELTTLIGNGVDPHDYLPSGSDTTALNDADFVFYSGGGLEEVLTSTLESFKSDGKAMALFDAVPEQDRLSAEPHHGFRLLEEGEYDPHFWHDPLLMKYAVSAIAAKLAEINPENQIFYENNLDRYNTEIDILQLNIVSNMSSLADDERILVTQHAAFNYFTHRYEFTALSLEGATTSDEAGLQEIDNLARELKENKVKVIFLETTVPDDNVQAVIEAAKAIGWSVKVGGTLLSGSLGENEQDNYIGMIEYNMRTIVTGISNPPAGAGEIETPINLTSVLGTLLLLVVIKTTRVLGKHRNYQ